MKLLAKLFIGLSLFAWTSCSNLFDDILNDDFSVKSGDSSLRTSTGDVSQSNPGSSGSSDSENSETVIIPNDNPEAYYNSYEDYELKNTETDSGIVVLKSTGNGYNQIIYNSDQHEYEIGYDRDEACSESDQAARKYSSSVYLCDLDDPVTVKAYKNDSNARITYSAIQTRTTNIADGSLSVTYIAEDTETFVDLPQALQTSVAFTRSSGDGDPIVFSDLPYGTTRVKITITADDEYYSDSYLIYLNKKHTLTSLVTAEEGNALKTDLTTGLVVLKESDGFNENQITYEDSVTDYETDLLTSDDNTVYLKAIPADKNAAVSWSASYVAEPVYKYEYYQTVTKTLVTVDSNGNLIYGPVTTSETNKVASASEDGTEISETTDLSDGSVTTTTVSTVTRKTITGLEKMSEVTPEDISSILLPVENQDTDRVRVTSLPYGETKVTATVISYDKKTPVEQTYTILLPRVQFTSSNTSSSEATSEVEDDTSKLEDLTVTNLETTDDEGNETSVETEASVTFTFDEDKTIYSLVVDEDTDLVVINPTLSENETMSNPVSKTKYSSLASNDYSVTLQGGLQVITFTVTEEGCEPRTYTIYVYKQCGNTILASIDYSSYDCVAGEWTEQSMASANYAAGLTAMSPSSPTLTNGAEDSADANTYTLKVRADNACDISKMTFTVKPYDSHTHIYYYAGSDCPSEDDSAWEGGYLSSDSSNEMTFELSNEGSTAITNLWLKTVSRPYYHSADFDSTSADSVSPRSDVTYHKIEISKPGNENVAFKEMIISTIHETGVAAATDYYLDTADEDGVTHTAGSLTKSVATDIDIAKIYFRLADKSDSTDSKTIKYTVKNERSSTTESDSNTEFTMSPAKDTESDFSGNIETVSGKKYYVISLGEIETEDSDKVSSGRTSNDLPMGKTTITVFVNGTESTSVIFSKPDLDCHTLTAKPAIGSGSYGVYTTSYYDTVFYLNNDTESVVLTMNTTQKNEVITVDSYEKTADENGVSNSKTYDVSDSDYITISQSTSVPYTAWTSEVKKIPVGTSVVVYRVTNADATNYTNCKVTFVRAENSETRLQSYSVSGPNNTTSGFSWDDAGTSVEGMENTYVNSYTLTDGSGTYSVTAKAMNENESVTVSVFGTNSDSAVTTDSIYDTSSDDWKDNEITTSSSDSKYTFDVGSDYKYILVQTIVANNAHTHYYYTIITVDLESTTGFSLTGKQYYNQNSSEGDVLDFTTLAATDLNSNGDIHIDVSKSDKASWIDGYPKVTLVSSEEDITSSVSVDSDKNITIPYSVYSSYSGDTIKLTYSASAEITTIVETFEYEIYISDFTKVTDYTSWTRSDTRSYLLPSSVTNEKQLAFRFGSQINDSSTNWIYTAADSGSKTGGVDIVGSLDSGSNWGATSYNFSGLHYLVQKGGSSYLAKLEAESSDSTAASAQNFYLIDAANKSLEVKSASELGINLSVSASVCYDGETPYLMLTASVEGADKLGVIMDTLVASEDSATDPDSDKVSITETNNGFKMSGSSYNFEVFLKNAMGTDDVTRFWYGSYIDSNGNLSYLDTVFTSTSSSLDSDTDSAISFSWDLSSTSLTSKTFRLTIE